MSFNVEYLLASLRSGLSYLPITIALVLASFLSALVIGSVIAAIRAYRVPVLSQISAVFVTIYMGLPLMVALAIYNLLFLTQYEALAAFFHWPAGIREVNLLAIGYLALTLNAGCGVSETIRGAFKSVDKSQFEAGYSVGFTKMQTLRRIIAPQVTTVALPGIVNILVGTIKGTNLVSAIGVFEVMEGALLPSMRTYSYIEGYVAAALIYWVLTIVCERVASKVEKNLGRYRRVAV